MKKFSCLGAVDEKHGIGKNGDVPWNLPMQFDTYFEKRSRDVKDSSKQNAVIMGRLTYFSFPEEVRPLKGRINVVLSNTLKSTDLPLSVMLFKNLDLAVQALSCEPASLGIENIFVCGGSGVYKEALLSPYCENMYLTRIHGDFDCDVFFPDIDGNVYKEISISVKEEENGVAYQLHVYSSRK